MNAAWGMCALLGVAAMIKVRPAKKPQSQRAASHVTGGAGPCEDGRGGPWTGHVVHPTHHSVHQPSQAPLQRGLNPQDSPDTRCHTGAPREDEAAAASGRRRALLCTAPCVPPSAHHNGAGRMASSAPRPNSRAPTASGAPQGSRPEKELTRRARWPPKSPRPWETCARRDAEPRRAAPWQPARAVVHARRGAARRVFVVGVMQARQREGGGMAAAAAGQGALQGTPGRGGAPLACEGVDQWRASRRCQVPRCPCVQYTPGPRCPCVQYTPEPREHHASRKPPGSQDDTRDPCEPGPPLVSPLVSAQEASFGNRAEPVLRLLQGRSITGGSSPGGGRNPAVCVRGRAAGRQAGRPFTA